MKKNQNVIIKGTKDGLTFHLDDRCSFDELKKELDLKILENTYSNDEHHLTSVKINVGNRFLTEEQEEEIKQLIRDKKNLVVDTVISNVMTKEEAHRLKAENEIVSVARVVRSGQVLEVAGDLLLVGDVNPGGTVKAGGNIFVMGALKGMAHAGHDGNDQAIIAASVMKPTQLRISQYLIHAPDQYSEEESQEMECAYLNEKEQIIIDRLQVLMLLRPNLTRLEGGR